MTKSVLRASKISSSADSAARSSLNMPDIQPVLDFLTCRTPRAWLEVSVEDVPTLLLDHAALELKAAQQALAVRSTARILKRSA